MRFCFEARPQPCLPVSGEDTYYPVGRIFCIGRNYVAHAAELGNTIDRNAPFFFTKSAHHLAGHGAHLPYPAGTSDYHHEVELVVALDKPLFRVDPDAVSDAIFGYAVGLDMTRRDLQSEAKDKRRPWDAAKDVEASAVIAPLARAEGLNGLEGASIRLDVNGETRQSAPLSEMVWTVEELVAFLSTLYRLQPGDLIMTGTPAGVGPVVPGDRLHASVDGLPALDFSYGERE